MGATGVYTSPGAQRSSKWTIFTHRPVHAPSKNLTFSNCDLWKWKRVKGKKALYIDSERLYLLFCNFDPKKG